MTNIPFEKPSTSADPTTLAIETSTAERDRLRAEVSRLSKALVEAYANAAALVAERDRLCIEVERLKTKRSVE